MAISAAVTLNSNGSNICEEHNRKLPNAVREISAFNFFTRDCVRFPQYGEVVGSDLANNANREPGPGERMARDDCIWQSELAANRTNLVLKERTQRFDELELEVIRKTADIVMTLDIGGAGPPARLNNVGIERSLDEELDFAIVIVLFRYLLRGFLEDTDKCAANDLPLGLRVTRITRFGKLLQKSFRRSDSLEFNSSSSYEVVFDLLWFSFTK